MSGKKLTGILAAMKYSKKQLESASQYRDKRDLIAGLLEEGKEYSFQEADELMNRYLKGRVK